MCLSGATQTGALLTRVRSYEKLKKLFADKDGKLSVPARLAAGAGAACFSTIVRRPVWALRAALTQATVTVYLPAGHHPIPHGGGPHAEHDSAGDPLGGSG